MALSASFNHSATAAQIIQRALEDIGVVKSGESVDSDDQSVALARLNDIAKQWSNPSDEAPGLKVWLRKFVYVFLGKGDRTYSLGPSGDKATESYSSTTIGADEAALQTVISATTETGMTVADVIGVVLDSGEIHWTTIASLAPLTITVAIPTAAATGNIIYWYTTGLLFQPVEILTAQLRDSNGKDTPLGIFRGMAYREFENEVPDKTTESDPVAVLYEPKRVLGLLTLDSAAKYTTKVLRLLVLSPADDLDSVSDEVCFPQIWFAALEWETAKRCSSVFEKPWTADRQANWEQATSIARKMNPEGYHQSSRYMAQDPAEYDPAL